MATKKITIAVEKTDPNYKLINNLYIAQTIRLRNQNYFNKFETNNSKFVNYRKPLNLVTAAFNCSDSDFKTLRNLCKTIPSNLFVKLSHSKNLEINPHYITFDSNTATLPIINLLDKFDIINYTESI